MNRCVNKRSQLLCPFSFVVSSRVSILHQGCTVGTECEVQSKGSCRRWELTMMMQRAIVTPIATETGASIPNGTSDTEKETRNRNNDSSGYSIWKNRRPHNPSSVPIPLLDGKLPLHKGHRSHRRDPLQQPSSNTKSSAEASSSLVSRRTLLAMFLIMVVCVVLEVISLMAAITLYE